MKRDSRCSPQKLEVGKRFKMFRERIGKTQYELAAELTVSQSAVANIERGKVFPGIWHLYYFHFHHTLSINWLLTGHGRMFMGEKPENGKYDELFSMMRIPAVEQVIFAKLTEAKALLRNEIQSYFEEKGKKIGLS